MSQRLNAVFATILIMAAAFSRWPRKLSNRRRTPELLLSLGTRPIATRRSRPPPTTPVLSPRLCRRRDLTWSARATSTVNPCVRPFAIFCRKRRRRAPTCRLSSISLAARFSITATTTSCRSTLRSIATPMCRSKRSALPISAMLLRRRRDGRASSFSMRRGPILTRLRVRRSAPGLALVDPERGELIAFNAAPGTLAGDEEGPYGVYGKTLAGAIRQGGVDIVQAFDQTRVSVNSETQGALLPWSASKLDGPFYVFERAADAPPPALSFAQTERKPISSFSAEDAYAAAVERDTLKGYREFLAAFRILTRRDVCGPFSRFGERLPIGAGLSAPIRPEPIGPICIPIRKARTSLTRAVALRCSRPSSSRRPIFGRRLLRIFRRRPRMNSSTKTSRSTRSTISVRLLPRRPPNMFMSKTTIGATCLRLRRLPRLACSLCWALRFRSPLARSHTNTVFITTASRRAGNRGCVRRPSRRRRCPPTSNPWPRLAPVAAAGPVANAAVVKPLRPIGRRGQPGGPGAAPGKPAGAPPATPPTAAAPAAPGQALKPLPVPPAAGAPAAAPPPTAGAKPAPGAAAPGGAQCATPFTQLQAASLCRLP